MLENEIYCSNCGTRLDEDSSCWFDEEIFCEDCLDDNTFICQQCGERFLNENDAGDSSTPLCNNCYSDNYVTCVHCDRVIHYDYAHYSETDDYHNSPYCDDCYAQHESDGYIQSYNYKPEPIFHGNDIRFFGVELEIDHGGKDDDNAGTLYDLANRYDNNIYIKSDGSLSDGLEIVTHPMTLEYHLKTMPWRSVVEQALDLGYTSHKSETCGLHVHVNKNSFSDSQSYQDICIARVLYIIERFWEELLRFSRRTEEQLKRWANRYGYKECPADILNTAKRGFNGRYSCVNLTNYDTIEFRIFRGTLKHNTLIATLQLVNLICDVASLLSDEDVARLGWSDFIERIDPNESPELVTYLKERRLYINEPVYCEPEV
jgi:hypothetical protein